ncbi:hypothetical protein GCM10009414_21140 [Tatumella terrea]|uniref:hypothetical protein n=1 Tax=Tatumella terrea TaxID=419007 RepID=UPI0031D38BCF
MTDISELVLIMKLDLHRAVGNFNPEIKVKTVYLQRIVEALEKAQARIAELENDEVRQRLANAEHQLYMAELAKHNLRASRKAQFRKRKGAEKRIAELEAGKDAERREWLARGVCLVGQELANRIEHGEDDACLSFARSTAIGFAAKILAGEVEL